MFDTSAIAAAMVTQLTASMDPMQGVMRQMLGQQVRTSELSMLEKKQDLIQSIGRTVKSNDDELDDETIVALRDIQQLIIKC